MKSIIKVTVVALVMGSLVATTFAGPPTNIITNNGRAPAFGSSTFNANLVAGRSVAVAIVGDGDTDLDIYVYDNTGRLLVSGIGNTDRELVRFVAPYSGSYRIVVRNLGNVYNDFSIGIR